MPGLALRGRRRAGARLTIAETLLQFPHQRPHRATESSSGARLAESWNWLICSRSFKWSYHVNFKISDVIATTTKVIAARPSLQVTMYIGRTTRATCHTMPTAMLNISRKKSLFRWKEGSSCCTFFRMGPQNPQGRTRR